MSTVVEYKPVLPAQVQQLPRGYRLRYNPTFSNGVKTESVQYTDAMEFDHTGELVMYDAINTIKNASGADIEYWDKSFLRVYNNPKSTFGDGKIPKLFGQ